MKDFLVEIDKEVFLFLNGLHHPFLDDLMAIISTKLIWIPLYAWLLFLLIKHYKKGSIYIVLFAVALIASTDQICLHAFKNVFERLRPCHEPSLAGLVHIVNDHCGGQFGFISSHAANTFGLAFFMGLVLMPLSRHWLTGLMCWAMVVGYSRIYLGVHYPLDVIVGGMVGITVAILLYKLLIFVDAKFNLKIIKS